MFPPDPLSDEKSPVNTDGTPVSQPDTPPYASSDAPLDPPVFASEPTSNPDVEIAVSAADNEPATLGVSSESSVNDPAQPPSVTAASTEPQPIDALGATVLPGAGMAVGSASGSPKKKLILLGIVTGSVLLVLASAYAVFALWYNNPQKVVVDAAQQFQLARTVVSDGAMQFTGGTGGEQIKAELIFASKLNNPDVNGEVEAKLKFTGVDKKTFEVTGGGMLSSSGAMYFKFDNVGKLFDQYLEDETIQAYLDENAQLKADIDAFIQKINGTWIKVDSEFIRQYTESFDYSKTKQCYQTAYQELEKNNAQKNQLKDVYAKNEFLKLTPQGTEMVANSLTNKYTVGVDVSKIYDATVAYGKTDFAKATHECDKTWFGAGESAEITKPSGDELRDQQQQVDKVKITVNISLLEHQLKRISVNYDDNDEKTSVSSQINLTQNAPVNVSDPATSIPVKELQADIEKIQTRLLESMMAAQETDS